MHQVTGSRICPLLSVCMPFATWIVTRGSSSFHRIRDSDQVFPLSRDTVNFTIPPAGNGSHSVPNATNRSPFRARASAGMQAGVAATGNVSVTRYSAALAAGNRMSATSSALFIPRRSVEDLSHYAPRHVGQTEPATLKLEDKLGVVDTHTPQDGGVQIVYVYWVFDDVITVVIRFAVSDAGLNAAASEPSGEAPWVVVA